MDPELALTISSVLLEVNELSPLEGSSLMEQTISFLHTVQTGGNTEQTQTKTKSAGNHLSQEGSLLSLDATLSETEGITDQGPIPAPVSSATPTPVSSETEMTPEDPVTLLMLAAPCEAKLEPVIPPPVPGLKEVMSFEDLSIFSSQPKESDLTPVDTSEFAYISDLSFRDMPENPPIPDQLLSFHVAPVQADTNNYGQLETPHPIPEYPAQPQLQSELLDGLKQNDLTPASQAALPQNITPPSSEVTQGTAMLLKNEKLLHRQSGFFQMQLGLHEMEPKSVETPPISIQSPTLGVGQRALIEEQELASFRGFPLCQPQASCSAQNPHLQPFHMHSLLGYGPQMYLPFFLTSSYLSTGPHLHASQTPSMPYPNYIQPNTLHLPPTPTVYANLKHSSYQLMYSCQQPGLQPSYILQNCFTPEMRFNMTNITFDNCPPLRSQLNLNCIQPTAVSHLNMNSSASLLHMTSPFPLNISGRQLKPNTHGIPQKLYENFRLWQEYCKVARTVYTSSPDLEALACFFIPVIRSFHVHCPDLPFSTAVRTAIIEWEKHSNFDRMNYYHMAQKFMEFEKKELEGIRAEQEPRASREFSVQTSEQSENDLVQSPYIVTDQAVNSNDQDLAEKALWEYSEIMKDLESKIKEGSEIAKETEEVDDEVEKGQFIEYLNEICSQKSVTEVGSEIDVAYVSSLLSSDSNTTDMLVQLGVVDNAKDVPTAITAEPVACHSSSETTVEYFSASPPKLHSLPETCDTQSLLPLQPGLYRTDGTVHPLPPSFNIPNLPNQPPNNPGVPLPNRYVLVSPQRENACQSGVPPLQKDITRNTFQLLHPPPGHLPHCQIAPYQNAYQGLQFFPVYPSSASPVVVQETVANSSGTLQANFPPCISHFLPKDRKEQNLLDVQNTSYTHETAQENSSSKKDIAEVRPTFMDKNYTFFDPSSTTARPAFTDTLTVFQNDSQSTLDCTDINIQKEAQIRYEKDNLIVVPPIDGSVGEMVAPKIDYGVGEMLRPTTDCSVGEVLLPTIDCGVGEMVAPTIDCGVGVPPTTDCSVGEMVPPTTDCGIGEFVPPPTDCGFEEMGTTTIDCGVGDSFFSESTSGEYKFKDIKKNNMWVVGIQKMKESKPEEQESCHQADAVQQSCSDAQLLHAEHSDYSDECQAEHLDNVSQLTEDEMAITQILDLFSKMKPLDDMSKPIEAILQTVEHQLNDHIQETGELLNTPGQKGEVAGSSVHVNNPQYFHVPRSKSYTDIALQVPQDDTAIVTQKVYDPLTDDHDVYEMSNPKIKAYNMQDEPSTQHLENMLTDSTETPTYPTGLESFMSDFVDLAIPSELLTLGLDSSDELDQMLLLSLGEVEVEFPQQDIHKSNEANNPPENTSASSVEKATATKEVTRTDAEAIKETDEHEDKVTEDNANKSRENETKNIQSKMSQQAHAESPVANEKVAVEMVQMTEPSEYNTRLEVGNRSRGGCITVADSMCTSEGELGQDQNLEAGHHKHNSYSIMKCKILINQDQSSVAENKNKELARIKKRKTRESLNQSKCDSPKNQSPKGRKKVEMENEMVKRSAVVQTQIMDQAIEIENRSKKEHRRVTRQSLKKDKMDVRQKKDRKNTVMRSLRSCKVVKEVSSENQTKRVNAEEKQTQGKSKGLRKLELKNDQEDNSNFVTGTKRTTRSFHSPVLEEAAGTQNAKVNTEKPNTRKDTDTNQHQTKREKVMKTSESSTNPKILTGRTKNLGTSPMKDFEGVQIDMDQENPNDLVGKKEKDHRHESIGRQTSQNLKKAETEVAPRIKDQRNKVRSCKVVVRDGFGENQKRRINKEERQTQRKSEKVSKQVPKNDAKSTTIFVMNTRRTRRGFNSLISENVAGTQNVKKRENSNTEMNGDTKQPQVEGKKKNKAADIKSSSNSDIPTGMRTRRKFDTDTHLMSEKRARECGPVPTEAAKKCAKTHKEGELKSNTPKRHDSSKSNGLAVAFAVRTDKLKEMNEKESQSKKEPKYKQCKAKNCIGDKRTDERLTRSYTASLQHQVENNEKEMRESDSRNRTKNQKEEKKISGVKKGVWGKQQKEARVDLKEKVTKEEKNKRCRITRCTVAVTRQVETEEQEMTTGTITRRKKMIAEQERMERRRKNITNETETSFISQAHGWRETKKQQQQRDRRAHNKCDESFVLVTARTRLGFKNRKQ